MSKMSFTKIHVIFKENEKKAVAFLPRFFYAGM